jgi:arsenate reductase
MVIIKCKSTAERGNVMTLVCYPKCTTCRKAKKWLEEKGVVFKERNIKENSPTVEELKEWHTKSGLSLKKFFNTSGQLYKELNLKDKLTAMSEEELYNLLASDGMLVKRPILVSENFVLVGFSEKEWEAAFETV